MEELTELTINQLVKKSFSYEGCGNRLLIIHLQQQFNPLDNILRKNLRDLGLRNNADSVLVITGDPLKFLKQGYHVAMYVFEPRGVDSYNPDLFGSWSTMCGNGVRAVTRYLIDRGKLNCLIKTGSGTRQVSILSDNQFRVCMGKFTMEKKYLKKYIRDFNFHNLIPPQYRSGVKTIIAGLNGDASEDGAIDGEPHLAIFLPGKFHLNQLMYLAKVLGPAVTANRAVFPECINTNFVVLGKRNGRNLTVNACTFERGVTYVTKACGTGATVIGSYLLSKNPLLSKVNVRMPGGMLVIEQLEDQYYMTGPANPLPET